MTGTLTSIGGLIGKLYQIEQLSIFAEVLQGVSVPIYDGVTEFTPSPETQTIKINGYRGISDITINPIPSNYGLITWNGSILTVS